MSSVSSNLSFGYRPPSEPTTGQLPTPPNTAQTQGQPQLQPNESPQYSSNAAKQGEIDALADFLKARVQIQSAAIPPMRRSSPPPRNGD